MSGVVFPQGCTDLTDQAEVLLDLSLLDRLPLCGQKSGTDALGENLKEGNGFLNVLEVRGGFGASCRSADIGARRWSLS